MSQPSASRTSAPHRLARRGRPDRSQHFEGKRVVLSTPEGFVYDMRAISEIHPDASGREVIDIATEEDYFRWMFSHIAPAAAGLPTALGLGRVTPRVSQRPIHYEAATGTRAGANLAKTRSNSVAEWRSR